MDPVVLFFLLGIIAGLARSDLRIPAAIYELLSIVLLLAIGLKGGIELSQQPISGLWIQIVAVLVMGFTLPLLLFPIARFFGRMDRANAASLAAHYGSVSVATFAVGIAWLGSRNIDFDPQLSLLLVLLEIPAIMVGIVLARGIRGGTRWGPLLHEIFLGKSIVLLLGGLVIGWVAGAEGIVGLQPLFLDLFKGFLALFLLEMGLLAASQSRSLHKNGLFLVAFGILMPLPLGTIGIVVGHLIDLNVGGAMLLGVLAGSASYIAAPAAMRVAVPSANPALSLTASLGITFPFNIFIGIPVYHAIAVRLHGVLG